MLLHSTKYLSKKEGQPWVTFIHGAGGNSTIWFHQIRFFEEYFNLLLIDLRGHGKSIDAVEYDHKSDYSFDDVSKDIIDVLDDENIQESHFVGISLGSILIRKLAENYPNRMSKMVLAGAILDLNLQSRFLMLMGKLTQRILPFMWIYTVLAYVVMPYKNHRKSRSIFIREAKKLSQNEFIRWYKLTADIRPLLKVFRKVEVKIPTLYIMGSQDYLFLPFVKEVIKIHKSASLLVLSQCGHVVNVEKPEQFNRGLLQFLCLD